MRCETRKGTQEDKDKPLNSKIIIRPIELMADGWREKKWG